MDDGEDSEADLIDLVVQLCTRISMIMEDISPLALEASREGLEERVAIIGRSTRTMETIAAAAQDLMSG